MSRLEDGYRNGSLLRSASVACGISHKKRNRVVARRYTKEVLEDYAFVGSVYFLESCNPDNFECVNGFDLSSSLAHLQPHFVRRPIRVSITNKAQHTIGN